MPSRIWRSMRRNLILWYHIIIRLLYLPVQSGVKVVCDFRVYMIMIIKEYCEECLSCINFIYCTVRVWMVWYSFPKQRGWSCNAMEKYWLNSTLQKLRDMGWAGLDMMWDYLRCTVVINICTVCVCKVQDSTELNKIKATKESIGCSYSFIVINLDFEGYSIFWMDAWSAFYKSGGQIMIRTVKEWYLYI